MKAGNYSELLKRILDEPENSTTIVNDITDLLTADELDYNSQIEKIGELSGTISELQATNSELIKSNMELRNEIVTTGTGGEEETEEKTELEKLFEEYEEENNKEE